MIERIEFLLKQKSTFAIETTLATRSYVNLIKRAKALGYEVNLLFFWLNSPETACQRVLKRVAQGGHNIPKDVIFRRYWLGLQNLFTIFMPIVDFWELHNNSLETTLIANKDKIIDKQLYNSIKISCLKKNEKNLAVAYKKV